MSIFYHEEPPNPSKRCRCLASALKDAFSNCHKFGGRLSSSPEEKYPASDSDDEQDEVVSVIRSRAMEAKSRPKATFVTDSFSWAVQQKEDNEDEDEEKEKEDFCSVRSCFSLCSSAASREAFFSVKTNFSRSSSLDGLDFQNFWRRSIIQEFCHCEGWPFGLCRRAVLLPPLPKSPSESWSWRKGARIVKMP
ncbi:hypothetical protein L1049_026476 [Liquidambar formosana]|uniref:Uncharacterized protein n=1 Tax=Liquidambar formosana TaxID=63359 RepID=A0AAP0NFN0_LIQFO